jgi:hypothetical protein
MSPIARFAMECFRHLLDVISTHTRMGIIVILNRSAVSEAEAEVWLVVVMLLIMTRKDEIHVLEKIAFVIDIYEA